MRQLEEVSLAIQQPTQLPGGPMTHSTGALLPLPPYTMYDGASLQLRVQTCYGVQGYKAQRKT